MRKANEGHGASTSSPLEDKLLSLVEKSTRRDNIFHVAKLPNLVGINIALYYKQTHNKEVEDEY